MARYNLVDSTNLDGRRIFCMPIAEPPPGVIVDYGINQIRYSPRYIDGPPRELEVRVADTDGFPEVEVGLPAPSMRLNSMASGWLTLNLSNPEPRLILDTPGFTVGLGIPWYQRWADKGLLPTQITYNNIDLDWTSRLVDPLRAGGDILINGLQLPLSAAPADASNYIDDFLAGNSLKSIFAESFAVIGAAGRIPETTDRLFRLSAHYDAVRSMHPRELLNLLFWREEADEFLNPALVSPPPEKYYHPLLRQLNSIDEMKLRPPLRTSKRIEWEARQEITWRAKSWGFPNRLLDANGNSVLQNPRIQNDADLRFYASYNKCNVFVSEICFRSGFRTIVYAPNRRYWRANAMASHGSADDRTAEATHIQQNGKTWALKRVPSFRQAFRSAKSAVQVQLAIDQTNHRISEEGRAYLIAIRRRDTDAKGDLRPGHVVLLESLTSVGRDSKDADDDRDFHEIGSLQANILEAATASARAGSISINNLVRSGFNYDMVSLLEIHPGGDPTEAWGIEDLIVRQGAWPGP